MLKDPQGRNWYPYSGYSMTDRLCKTLLSAQTPIVIYDTETTGVAKTAYVVQFAGLRCEPKDGRYYITQTLDQFIKPPIPMPAEASAVNHITDDILQDKPIEAMVVDKLDKFMEGAMIAGYNHVSFDNKMMQNMYQRTKGVDFLPFQINEQNLDAMIIARGLVGRDQLPDGKFTLGNISALYGIEPDEDEHLHDALADTKVTMKLLWALARDYQDSDVAEYFRSLSDATPNIEIYRMRRLTYSKTSDYVVIDVSCMGAEGQIRYEVYDKRFVEMSGNVMSIGNMEKFILDADRIAGGSITKVKAEGGKK